MPCAAAAADWISPAVRSGYCSRSRAVSSGAVSGARENCVQRERIVGRIALAFSVIRMKNAYAGGSSRILSSAFCADTFIFCAWRMRKTRRALSFGRTAQSERMARAVSTLISASCRSISVTSGWMACSTLRHTLQMPHGGSAEGQSRAAARMRARVSFPIPTGPVSRIVWGKRTASARRRDCLSS